MGALNGSLISASVLNVRRRLRPRPDLNWGDPDWSTRCQVCDGRPTVHPTGWGGPGYWGESFTGDGNWGESRGSFQGQRILPAELLKTQRNAQENARQGVYLAGGAI